MKKLVAYKPVYRARKDQKGDTFFDVTMKVVGEASSFEEAKRKYGRYVITDAEIDVAKELAKQLEQEY